MESVSVVICNCVDYKQISRLKLDCIDQSGSVLDFRNKVSKTLHFSKNDIDLVYRGRCLNDKDSLASCGVKSGVTVYVMKKNNRAQHEEKIESVEAGAVVTALQTILVNPRNRTAIKKVLNSHEILETIIRETAGLSTDPVAIAMLQDPELLAIIANPSHIHRLLEAHPSLGSAALKLSAKINEECGQTESGPARGTFSLDQMSDEEEMAESRQPRPITTRLLAAALATTGSVSSALRQASPEDGTSQGPTTSSAITPDFFQQAIMQASGLAGASAQPAVTESQLQQLREMGITDEDVARRALEATGGNIHAALDLIYGGSS